MLFILFIGVNLGISSRHTGMGRASDYFIAMVMSDVSHEAPFHITGQLRAIVT